jgi:hypothetical protein
MQRIILILLFSLPLTLVYNIVWPQTVAPAVLNTSGGTHSFGYANIDWSVGEMPLINTGSSSLLVVTNGFLQPFTEKPSDTDIGSLFSPDEIRIFPNPSTSYVEINFLTQQKGNLSFRLYNSLGQLQFEKTFYSYGLGRIERINMERLPSTEYFLQIVLDPEPGSVRKKGGYKIIKLQ